ncbi:hypothetical protein ACM01_15240 [Streptomyces viridochromogenes]|uniref:Secreted protein n=1 Tax=Streptomyces viridochromogenes TaxID=1938 RepID=A0A0J7ZGF5_STRVR|nr:hypothetical protein [Streptomyces viridochromogenes]KMS74258.1 hypothetical protein ACM01_15240 [Streptomyces viridochromogenes]
MTIFCRALSVAALAGACALTAAAPASANVIGENLAVAQIASQQTGLSSGNQQSTSNHGSNNGNTAQQGVADNQDIDVIKNIADLNTSVAIF